MLNSIAVAQHSFKPSLSWRGNSWGFHIVSQDVPKATNYWTKIADIGIASREKIPNPQIPFIASTYYGKCAIPFLLGHSV